MAGSIRITEADLRSAMREARYWRDGHPEREAFGRWVANGWRALCPTDGGARAAVWVRAYSATAIGSPRIGAVRRRAARHPPTGTPPGTPTARTPPPMRPTSRMPSLSYASTGGADCSAALRPMGVAVDAAGASYSSATGRDAGRMRTAATTPRNCGAIPRRSRPAHCAGISTNGIGLEALHSSSATWSDWGRPASRRCSEMVGFTTASVTAAPRFCARAAVLASRRL
jgi:hypothetical protein